MDCNLIQSELVAYHFETTTDELRERVDAHLLGCTACLRAYLRLKHHVERGASLMSRPSPTVRRRIRDDVGVMFRPTLRTRLRLWMQHPIPLYQGLAAAACVIVLAVGIPALVRNIRRLPAPAQQQIDTSRTIAESFTLI